jgi:hypothetical protein
MNKQNINSIIENNQEDGIQTKFLYLTKTRRRDTKDKRSSKRLKNPLFSFR